MIKVKVVRLPHAEELPFPSTATIGSAGFDLLAAIPRDSVVILKANGRALVPTGLLLHIPVGYEGQVRPRSGLALKHGITVLNSPGTIDSDYRGEIQVLLINLGEEDYTITRGMRIAQLVVAPCLAVVFTAVETLEDSPRGTGGFGSTGVHA
jgi:dUTP pyrophosphatase